MNACHYWAAYFPDGEQPTAYGVCMAESGGRVDARNCSSGRECSLGLGQVNVYAHHHYDPDRLVNDADYNARASREIYDRAGGWTPWGAYTAGTYLRYLGEEAVDGSSPPAAGGLAPALLVLAAAFLLLEVL